MSNLATYSVHEKVMREFKSHLNRPAQPGYKAASVDAILRADRELWTRVADKVRSELRADKDGELHVDKALTELHTSPSVVFHLLPLPSGSAPSNTNKRKTVEEETEVPKKVQPKAQPKKRVKTRQGRTNLPAVDTAPAGAQTFADVFLVEVFCGKAGLSRALRQRGFQVFSVDHKAVKGIPILMIDLKSNAQRKIFDELLAQRRLLYVHVAPPCDTASLALKRGPKPLRSLRFPMGLPNLPFVSRERVRKANNLYSLTWFYINKFAQQDVGWSVENANFLV
eukprot:s3525_g7.t1